MEIHYNPRALADLERLFDFVAGKDEVFADAALEAITSAIDVLRHHPYLGRPIRGPLRELVISHGRTGFVALYRVDTPTETLEILTIRAQREAGYA